MRYKVQNQAGEVYKAENIELDSNFVTMRFWNSEDRVSINDILSIKRSYPEAEKHTASELNAKYSIKTKDGNTHNASDYEYIHGLIVIKFHYGELWLPKMNILSVQGEYPSSKIPSNLELNYKVIVEGGNVYQASDVEVAFGLIRIKFDNDELKLPLGSILSIQKAYSKAEIAANKSEKLSPRVMVETKSDRVYKAFDVEVGFGFVTIKLLEYELQLPAGEILSTRKTYLKSDTVVEKKSGELRSTIIKTKTGKTYKARGVEVAFGFVTMKFWNGELRLQAGEILSITKTYLTDDLAPIVRTKLRYTVKTKTGKEYKARGVGTAMGFVTMRFWTGELHLPAGEILSVKRSYSFKEVRRSILKAVSKREILSGVSYRLKTRAGKVYRAKDVEVALGFVTMKFWTGELRLPAGELLSVKKTYLETLPSQ